MTGWYPNRMSLMLSLVKKSAAVNGFVTAERINAAGQSYRPYDRRYVGNNNFARVGGLRNLAGLTLGIVGMGEIGREVAPRARSFAMSAIYHQRQRLTAAEESRLAASWRALPELFSTADIVTLHLPLTPRTRGLIGPELLGRMKPGSFLINTSRAEVVGRQALIDALRSAALDGAGLDVQYDEPVRFDDPLLGLKNVLLTPHVAGGARTNLTADIEEVVLKIWDGIRQR